MDGVSDAMMRFTRSLLDDTGGGHQDRIARLKAGDYSFGCNGQHYGSGAPGCSATVMHHHHDIFCRYPSEAELKAAGIDPETFRVRSRA